MANRLTLQINSLEAIERLIGGDSVLEMEIRESIVQKFTNKHLKGIANVLIEKFKKDSETEFIRRNYRGEFYLGQKALDLLRSQMNVILFEHIDKQIADVKVNAARLLEERVKAHVDDLFAHYSTPLLQNMIDERARRLIAEKLKS